VKLQLIQSALGLYKFETKELITMIDTVSNLVELVCLDNASSAHVGLQFENTWLARFATNASKEQHSCRIHNCQKSTSKCYLRANAAQSGKHLRTLMTLHPPSGIDNANRLVDTALANCLLNAFPFVVLNHTNNNKEVFLHFNKQARKTTKEPP
jgi:hypothetical protein